MQGWTVEVGFIQDWLMELPSQEYLHVLAALEYLGSVGPHGGRPFIDRITGSSLHNLKELRPRGHAKNIRILFIFDPEQQAILLVAGDKTGQWNKWYKQNIPLAEKRYEEYLRKRHDNS
ncbi:hypothetical protein A7979_06380 [Rothia nasimurium]|uniref:Diaminopimelate decarboxylase n=2 Tax=Micrococcaceae TaxID=1268 RepID=A0A1Y1RMR0_9MICC|nr:hypothetical protein A7979_06380 [Rothia nasimurium]